MVKETFKKITSLQNPLVKHLLKLKENRAYREAEQAAIVMGNKNIEQIVKHVSPLRIFTSDPLLKVPANVEKYVTSIEILKKISKLSSFQETIAEFPLPQPQSLHEKKYLIAFDEITDPGNLGTLMRTALALGWEGAIFLPGCCDLFNDKTIRASKGGSFLLPFQYGTHEMLFDLSEKLKAPMLVADLEGNDLSQMSPLSTAILVLSHEAKGVKDHYKKSSKFLQKVTIPISKNMESLNVAAAGAILMYQLKKS